MSGVVLLTRDLRAHDHPAIAAAHCEHGEVVLLFVRDERLRSRRDGRSCCWPG